MKSACALLFYFISFGLSITSSGAIAFNPDLNDEKVRLMMNHINSEKRDSLNGHSPYELSLLLLDNKLHKALGLKAIAPDDVVLSPKLIK